MGELYGVAEDIDQELSDPHLIRQNISLLWLLPLDQKLQVPVRHYKEKHRKRLFLSISGAFGAEGGI